MKRIAVIGSGISGLAAAYYLSRKHQVTVFERDQRIGGHTHTIDVGTPDDPLAVDTGFIVHNDVTYPNFIALMAELNVKTAPSDMSFGVHDPVSGFQYSSRGLGGFFAQRRNLFNPVHYELLREIIRFNKRARQLLERPDLGSLTLGEVMDEYRFAPVFRERYLYPMAAAVWSMPPACIHGFPAMTLLQFFRNHGMLGINTHPAWKVLRGGSKAYLGPLTAPYRARIFTEAEILTVTRGEGDVTVHFKGRPAEVFDDVVFACHGNQILPLLQSATDAEREVLGSFHTSRNETCLHTDSTLLPSQPAARASWNYALRDPELPATLTYHMNRLQSLNTEIDYCVTLNDDGRINPSAVIRRMVYHHPIYNAESVRAQARWVEISGRNHTHFCGAYWFCGFHEDGVNSALRVARGLGIGC